MSKTCFPRRLRAKPLSARAVAVALLVVAGCGGSQPTDIVFDIKLARFLPDGRPVIEIKPNGKPRPEGAGPFGDYFLVLRSSSDMPYTRQFDKDQAAQGVELDFAVTKKNFPNSETVTVAVENPSGKTLDNTTRLSNVIELKFPAGQ